MMIRCDFCKKIICEGQALIRLIVSIDKKDGSNWTMDEYIEHLHTECKDTVVDRLKNCMSTQSRKPI